MSPPHPVLRTGGEGARRLAACYNPPMLRLAHLSDLHIAPLPTPRAAELLGKRLTGYLNWTRGGRALHHRPETLEAIIADIRARGPDAIAVTGDLVNIALPAEFPLARAMLEALGPPDRVALVPGNHDIYARGADRMTLAAFGPYLAGDHEPPARRLADAFPSVRRMGRVALVGVNSGVATAPFMATGALGRAQRETLAVTLRTLGEEGLWRVLMIHHPPFDIGFLRRLTDWRALGAVLADEGCELVLHGHTHDGTVVEIDGPDRPIPVVGVPSASAADDPKHAGAAWNLFEIGDGGIELIRRDANGRVVLERTWKR